MVRSRSCNNPSASFGGQDCTSLGPQMEQRNCIKESCPGKLLSSCPMFGLARQNKFTCVEFFHVSLSSKNSLAILYHYLYKHTVVHCGCRSFEIFSSLNRTMLVWGLDWLVGMYAVMWGWFSDTKATMYAS
jgi:hypothetical protein